MIHAFALEPRLVATWGRREEYRFVHDKFGFGTPRALLEFPKFSKWKKAVYEAAIQLDLSAEDMKRLEELFKVFGEHRCRRADSVYDGVLAWLENAQNEYDRRPFAAVLATANPGKHPGVLVFSQLLQDSRWACSAGATPARTPKALADVLSAMLINCRNLHLIDPYFDLKNSRHRNVLQALLDELGINGHAPELIRIHCSAKETGTIEFFEGQAPALAALLPAGISVEFVRWEQRAGGDRLHNRYILTDLGGIMLGIGIEQGEPGETDDLLLLPRAQYDGRWSQYVGSNGTFKQVGAALTVRGTRVLDSPRRTPPRPWSSAGVIRHNKLGGCSNRVAEP